MGKRNMQDMKYLLNEISRSTDLMISILNDMDSIKNKADDLNYNKNYNKNYSKNHYIKARSSHSNHIEDDILYKIKRFLISLNDEK